MWKRLFVGAVIIAVLGTAYWFGRSYFRFPFDQLSVFEAVPQNTAALLRLSSLSPDTVVTEETPLWYLDAKRVAGSLARLDLTESVEWGSWWLLPVQGNGPLAATYTLIGAADAGLNAAWNPSSYGPAVASSEGEVYTFEPSSEVPLYFGRHRNLFVAGKFAFQVESVLSAAQGNIPAWEDDENFKEVIEAFQELGTSSNETQLVLQLENIASSLPTNWYLPEQLRFWQPYADWLLMDFIRTDSSCTINTFSTSSSQQLLSNSNANAWQWVPEISESALPISSAVLPNETGPNSKTSWIGDEAWKIILPNLQVTRHQGEVWVLPIGDTSSYAAFREIYLRDDRLTDQQTYQLYELRQLQTAEGFDFLTDRRRWQPWFVEVPNGLIVGVFREDVERYLDYHLVGGMINNQEYFLNLKQGLPSWRDATQQGFLRWGPLADAETNILNLLFPGTKWSQQGCAAFVSQQLEDRVLRTVVEVVEVTDESLPATIRWTLPLTTSEKLKLYPVKEVGVEESQYFVIQSDSGQTWLLDLEGTIWWERQSLPQLFPPVWHWREEGSRLRWSATSPQGLYVWDDHGLDIPLPISSSAPASGLSIFTFDARGTPILAYPNQNQQLELRSTDGNLLPGWPAELSGRTNADFPLVHWQTEVEDLIIAWTPSEAWQVFNRAGNYLNGLPNVPEPLLGTPAYDFYPLQPEQSRLMGATNTGKVNVWNLAGDIVPIPLGRGPLDRWLFENIWGDSRPDHVAQRGSLVHLFGFENDRFAERWQQRFSSIPDTIITAAPLGILVLSDEEEKIWFIDKQGQIPSSFPLAGSSGAYLRQTDENHCVLVTLLAGKVYAYDLILSNS